MQLPIRPLPRDSVVVNGQSVEFRSLSRAEAMKVTTGFTGDREAGGPPDPDGAEIFVLMCGTDSTADEVAAFRQGSDMVEGGKLVDAILVLSGLAVRKKDGRAVPNAQLRAVG